MDAGKTGAYLAALRKARGMTQQEAADQMGVSNKTVSKWENGAGLPDITVLPALAELYGVTADDILAGETLRGRPAEAQGPARRRLLLLRLRTRFDLCFIGSLALGVLAAIPGGLCQSGGLAAVGGPLMDRLCAGCPSGPVR